MYIPVPRCACGSENCLPAGGRVPKYQAMDMKSKIRLNRRLFCRVPHVRILQILGEITTTLADCIRLIGEDKPHSAQLQSQGLSSSSEQADVVGRHSTHSVCREQEARKLDCPWRVSRHHCGATKDIHSYKPVPTHCHQRSLLLVVLENPLPPPVLRPGIYIYLPWWAY